MWLCKILIKYETTNKPSIDKRGYRKLKDWSKLGRKSRLQAHWLSDKCPHLLGVASRHCQDKKKQKIYTIKGAEFYICTWFLSHLNIEMLLIKMSIRHIYYICKYCTKIPTMSGQSVKTEIIYTIGRSQIWFSLS